MVLIKLPAKKTNEKTFEAKYFLKLSQCLKTLPQDLSLCDLITVLARFQKYLLSLRRYSTSKSL